MRADHEGTSPNREDLSNLLDISDDDNLDSELGRRLNQMVPIPVSSFNGVTS